MKKTFMMVLLIGLLLISVLETSGTAEDQPQIDKKAITEMTPKIQKWGQATLTIKDDKGNVILNRTEKYPIVDRDSKDFNRKYDPANWNENCWNWCRKVCDGYGVCWVSCGWHCSPWTK